MPQTWSLATAPVAHLKTDLEWSPMRIRTLLFAVAGLAIGTLSGPSAATLGLADEIHAATLDNGMRVIMVPRPFAPIIRFHLSFDVGGIDEPDGLGGLAHMVEHMAFKGTRSIGSRDPLAEQAALHEVEVLVAALSQARAAGYSADDQAWLAKRLEAQRARARELAENDALDRLFEANGGVGLNAGTGYDRTRYTIGLPRNRLELYARVYADVLRNPVFRSFYAERDVVREERRQRSEDDPQGVLIEALLAEAFRRHPYGRPLIGAAEEIAGYTATAARAFFTQYYVPNRAVLVLVGDVDPDQDLAIIERYFGILEPGRVLQRPLPAEPEQAGPRAVEVSFDAEPQLMLAFRKPTYPDPDAYALDLLEGVLTGGRTGRLVKSLVFEQRIAAAVGASASLPGIREPNLFTVFARPRHPHTVGEVEQAIRSELERLVQEGVTAAELDTVKNRVRADFLRTLRSSSSLASLLAEYEHFFGGWERLFDYVDRVEAVRAEDVRSAAARHLRPETGTTARLTRGEAGGSSAAVGPTAALEETP